MPGFPVASGETPYSRSTDQPTRQDACVPLSEEEKLAAEETFSVYCKPVEFYNILQGRAKRNPLFLQRCLDHRIKAKSKNKKRIQMTVSLSWSDEETKDLFPLHICVARRDPNNEDADKTKKYSAVYGVSRILTFRGSSRINRNNQIQANFMLPEVNTLAVEARSGSLAVLFFTAVDNPNSSSTGNANPGPLHLTFHKSRAAEVGEVSLESLYMSWDSSPNFSLGQRAEIMSTVDLLPCILKYDRRNGGQSISIQDLCNSENVSKSKQVQITISAEEFGAMERSPYLTYTSSDASSSSSPMSRFIRLKEGNVMYNYRYYNNKLQRTEVIEDFCCPICLVRCASYKGLRRHSFSSHDLFNFEFSAPEDRQAVNVSVKTDIWRFELVADGVDPKSQTFIFCWRMMSICSPKSLKRRTIKKVCSENAKDADPPVLAKDVDPSVLAEDADPPVLAKDVDPSVLAEDADPPVLAKDVDPSVLAEDADPPVLAKDVDPSVLAEDADPPVLAEDAYPPVLESEIPAGDTELLEKADGVSNATVSNPDPDCVPPISEHDHGTPAVLQIANTGRLPVEHSDPRNIALLKKRLFYHSHKLQPLSLEEVLADDDSEDEVDDEVADIEMRRMLDLLDVTIPEKKFMFMWNRFVKKQCVRADGHIHWTCEAFSKMHGPELVQSELLNRCWRLFRIKLYNHGLIDGKTFHQCTVILEQYQKQNSDPEI